MMKVAIYKRTSGNWSYETIVSDDKTQFEEGIRLTEWTDVEFIPLPPAETIAAELAAIDSAEKEFDAKVADQKAKYKDQRAKLLAIPHIANN